VALHLGEILWGNIGAADRLDFTAIGSAVNLVSRLEGLCRPLGGRPLTPMMSLITSDTLRRRSPLLRFAHQLGR
jgi:class 3 adenylate cyclase